MRWLRANAATYGIDPTRIGIGGESAGAITATLVGLLSEDVGTSGNPGWPSTVGGFVSVSGGVPTGVICQRRRRPRPVLPRLGRQHRARLVVGEHRYRDAERRRGRHGSRSRTERATCRGRSTGPLYLQQADWFLYLTLDLAHAAGQPPAAARASEQQLRKLEASPSVKRQLKKHPKLKRVKKRALRAGVLSAP